jgi:crotonobetainyl-CoA:carnitine CoA-transferase CaiB-like acyl-CoA transferase
MDPRSEGTQEDRIAQFNFLKSVRDKVDETHDAIRHMRATRSQISALIERLEKEEHPELFEASGVLDSTMIAIEEVLYQRKLKSNQDMLNYPIKLNNKLAHVGSLASMGIYRPTDQMEDVRQDISAKIDEALNNWYALRDDQLPEFNALIRSSDIEFIEAPQD